MPEWLAPNLQWIFSGIGVVVLGALLNAAIGWVRRRRPPQPDGPHAAFGAGPKNPRPAEIEILPLSFNASIRQEIPQLEVWLYVVNHLPREVLIQSLKIPQFGFTGGPTVEDVSIAGEPTLPARYSTPIILRRPLIDSEVRAIQRAQQRNPANASFRIIGRMTARRKTLLLDIPHISSNGWIEGIPGSS